MVSDTCTSSNRRPLVSGTSITTNGMVKKHMLENMKNVPAEFHSNRKLNEYETTQELLQLTSVTRLPAEPFM